LYIAEIKQSERIMDFVVEKNIKSKTTGVMAMIEQNANKIFVSPKDAASLLGISYQSLIEIISEEKVQYTETEHGKSLSIKTLTLLEKKIKDRRKKRQKHLDFLTKEAQELNFDF
jgi:hypothetical protein